MEKAFLARHKVEETRVFALHRKGNTEIYFDRIHNSTFSRMLLENMLGRVEKEYKYENERGRAIQEVFLTTREIVSSVGLKPKIVDVCESMMKVIAKEVLSKKDKLSNYLKAVQTNSDLSFQFRFIELTSHLATQFVYDLGLPQPEEQVHTVVCAALFCDVALKDEKSVQLRSEEELENLWHKERSVVERHPAMAAELIAASGRIPQEASTVIRQHHGSLEGHGFPKTYPQELHILAKCLLVAQELALELLKHPEVSPAISISKVRKKFEGTPLAEVLSGFRDNFLKESA
jgi:response regulator RpfG family c-di-GMP phosphodiesterase